MALYGNAANAAYQIGVQILSFSFLVGFGFSIAASTLVGQHLGAGDPAGAERSGWRAMWLAVGVMVVFGTAIIVFARPIAQLLIDDAEVVRLAVVFIRLLGSVQALMAIEFTLGRRAARRGRHALPALRRAGGHGRDAARHRRHAARARLRRSSGSTPR